MSMRTAYSNYFPYKSLRQGQEEMMRTIEEAVRQGNHICIEAPNGFGKTCVTLSGVLPWVKENDGKILYCARTHRQLDRVVEELSAIREREDVSGISFRGRRHMCINEFVIENAGSIAPVSEVCGHLKSAGKCPFYERLRNMGSPEDLLLDMPKRALTAPDIIKYAKKQEICPYELAKKLAKAVDVIALSYLYVFDPFILETFIPELEVPLAKTVLIEDEAHNVPTTALDSASDTLTLRTIRQAITEANTYNDTISKKFGRGLTKTILDLSENMPDNSEMIVDPVSVYTTAIKHAKLEGTGRPLPHMRDLGSKIKKGLVRVGKFPISTIYRVAEFLLKWLDYSERDDFAFILSTNTSMRGTKRVALELVALDPTSVTNPILRRVHCAVAVSGTISPLKAYAEMLGLGASAKTRAFQSPFARRNRLGIVVEGLDTSYVGRSQETYKMMVDHCVAVAHATPGNTGIFATSYAIVKALIKAGLGKRLKKKIFVERQGMKNTENDDLIEKFKDQGEGPGAVLLGVQGGRNSEGGDFPGYTMNSVIVVGVPYARPTPRIEALIKYFDARFRGRGRDYAYVLPATTRAIQAAGRPVRRLDDRGAIVLLDQRFATPYLKRFLPRWLSEVTEVLPNDPSIVAEHVHSFFEA
ncbi:MAG: helicase C-terminal domain-containing protein [Candidatus Thorarchaeota archaeon]